MICPTAGYVTGSSFKSNSENYAMDVLWACCTEHRHANAMVLVESTQVPG